MRDDVAGPDGSGLSEGLGHLAQQNESPLLEVVAELGKALRKFPTWPTDPLHALAVLGEEYGELNKAMLQLVYEPHKTSAAEVRTEAIQTDRKSTRLNSSHQKISYAVLCLKKKIETATKTINPQHHTNLPATTHNKSQT